MAPPIATVADTLKVQLTAAGGSGQGYQFSAADLPNWLTLSNTGLLNGTPPGTTGSRALLRVSVTDSVGASANRV